MPANNPSVATYSFNGMDLRVVEIGGEPWFVAVDAYIVLYGKKTGIRARDFLSPSDMQIIWKKGLSESNSLSSLFSGSQYRIALISESGLYKLVMRSDKKEAKQFQEWVTREVLPSIRKTGTYTMPGAKNVPPYT